MNASADVELLAAYWTLAGDRRPFSPEGIISPFPFRDRVEVAAKVGWKGVGLLLADIQATTASVGLGEMRRILEANGIRHVELELLIDWHLDGERRARSDKNRRAILEYAEALGARTVKVAGGRGKDPTNPRPEELVPDVARLTDAFARLCRDAADHGTSIVLELTPFSNVSTIEVARQIVEEADQPNGGLLLDIWHIARGGNSYGDIKTIPSRFIGSIELDDADAHLGGRSLWDDTVNHRKLPGGGALDVPAFISAVRAAGYQGPWGVEILSATHRKLTLREAAAGAFEATMALFKP
jgi:sugar phosphate isomerase/epimerase